MEELNKMLDNINKKIEDYAEQNDIRICSECGRLMDEGYVVENCEWYCSDECLHANITEKEFLKLYDDGNGDSYWTEWR